MAETGCPPGAFRASVWHRKELIYHFGPPAILLTECTGRTSIEETPGMGTRDWLAAALIVVLVVPLDVLAAGHPNVQVVAPICGAVTFLARLVVSRFRA